MRAEQSRDGLLIHLFGGEDKIGAHEVAHERVSVGGKKIAKIENAQEALRIVEHVGVIDGLNLRRLPPQIADRLIHRHFRPKPREAGTHQPAGGILFIRHERVYFASRDAVKQGEQRSSLVFRCELKDIGGIVRREQAQPHAPFAWCQREKKLHLIGAAQLQKERACLFARKVLEGFNAFVFGKIGPCFEDMPRRRLHFFKHEVLLSRRELIGAPVLITKVVEGRKGFRLSASNLKSKPVEETGGARRQEKLSNHKPEL